MTYKTLVDPIGLIHCRYKPHVYTTTPWAQCEMNDGAWMWRSSELVPSAEMPTCVRCLAAKGSR